MVKFIFAFLFLAFSQFLEEDNVIIVTDRTFDKILEYYPQILIEFYAPWCTFCQQLAPMYAKAALRLKEENPPIRIAKINAVDNIESALKYNIEGFPTLKFFVNGNPNEYTGQKNELGIVKWLLKKMGPPVKYISVNEYLQDYIEKNQFAVVLFTNNKEIQGLFEKNAKNSEELCFAICENQEIFNHYSISDPGLIVFKHNDAKKNIYNGIFIETEMMKFIENNLAPWIIPFNDKAIQLVFGRQNPCLFVFRSENQDNLYADTLQKVANNLKGSLLISYADLSLTNNKRLVEFLGFPASWMPFALIINGKLEKFLFKNTITEESLLTFVDNWKKGVEKPYLKSQSLPATEYEDNVRIIVGENFSKVAFDRNADVLVKFYAPWCRHCKKLAPEYAKLAKKFAEIESIVIAKVDATENEIEGFDIQEFPTIKFFPANNKEGIDYVGKKDSESLEEFIKTNAALPLKKTDL